MAGWAKCQKRAPESKHKHTDTRQKWMSFHVINLTHLCVCVCRCNIIANNKTYYNYYCSLSFPCYCWGWLYWWEATTKAHTILLVHVSLDKWNSYMWIPLNELEAFVRWLFVYGKEPKNIYSWFIVRLYGIPSKCSCCRDKLIFVAQFFAWAPLERAL